MKNAYGFSRRGLIELRGVKTVLPTKTGSSSGARLVVHANLRARNAAKRGEENAPSAPPMKSCKIWCRVESQKDGKRYKGFRRLATHPADETKPPSRRASPMKTRGLLRLIPASRASP